MLKPLITLSIALVCATQSFAMGGSVPIPINATEITQIMNNAELGSMVYHQTQEVANQLIQLRDMAKNSGHISDFAWGRSSDLIRDLYRLRSKGHDISNKGQQYEKMYESLYYGYKPPENYSDEYQNWSNSSIDSIKSSVAATDIHTEDLATEEKLMYKLKNLSQSSEGRMQALQVSNMIAIEQVDQMRKLRTIQLSQMQAHNSYMATQIQQDATAHAASKEFIQTPRKKTNKFKTYKGGLEK